MSIMKTVQEAAAEGTLTVALGKDWRDRIIPFLSSELTPFLAGELGEAFDISGQSAATCCKALETLDLLTCYAKRIKKAGYFDSASAKGMKQYYLMHDLAETDKDEFVLFADALKLVGKTGKPEKLGKEMP